jgi:hypothetical protein
MRKTYNILLMILIPTATIYAQEEAESDSRVGVAVVPIIDYDPTFSLSIGAAGQLFYQLSEKDTISPLSSTGFFGMYTFNGSLGLAGFQKFHLNEDRWRIFIGGGFGSVNFQFWQQLPIVDGVFIGFNTKANFGAAIIERQVFNKLYVGISGVYAKTQTLFDLPEWVPDSLKSSDLNMHNLGYGLTYDKRDHQYSPYRGYYLSFKHNIYPEWLNNPDNFSRISITYNHYYRINNERHIVATRFNAKIATGDVPFQGQNVVGGDDIRGYTSGKYRNNQVYALQAEYRWRFYKRFGAVGFFGLATATEDLASLTENELLPGGGIGFRFLMLPEARINIGTDIAFGKEDWGVYFRIGEAFGR